MLIKYKTQDNDEEIIVDTKKIKIIDNDLEYTINLDKFGGLEIIKSSFGEESSSVIITPKVSNHINLK